MYTSLLTLLRVAQQAMAIPAKLDQDAEGPVAASAAVPRRGGGE